MLEEMTWDVLLLLVIGTTSSSEDYGEGETSFLPLPLPLGKEDGIGLELGSSILICLEARSGFGMLELLFLFGVLGGILARSSTTIVSMLAAKKKK